MNINNSQHNIQEGGTARNPPDPRRIFLLYPGGVDTWWLGPR
jgi:hypothetical protein